MVIESLLNPLKAEKKPWEMFFIGILYSSIGILLSLWIFADQASLVMVFLTVMACIPIVYSTMKLEEKKDLAARKEGLLMKEHFKAISFLMFLFVGVMVSCSIWYAFMPEPVSSLLFDKQVETINAVNGNVTGMAVDKFSIFSMILSNNIKVLAFAILFSFIYCVGAIFILVWNATVIGVAIGNIIKSSIASSASLFGFSKAAAYFSAVVFSPFNYAIHGIPEIVGYFYGGLAGGIISVAIINQHYKSKNFAMILFDASELLVISIACLLVAAVLEVYVTPMFF